MEHNDQEAYGINSVAQLPDRSMAQKRPRGVPGAWAEDPLERGKELRRGLGRDRPAFGRWPVEGDQACRSRHEIQDETRMRWEGLKIKSSDQ